MSFAIASAVAPAAEGRWRGEIAPGWDIAGAANGGYLMSIAARAATLASGRPDPVSVTAHYLAPGTPGAIDLSATVLKEGRRFSTVEVSMVGTRPLLHLLGTFGDLGDSASASVDPALVLESPPDLPDPDDCIEVEPTDGFPPPFMGKVELRLPGDLAKAWSGVGAPRVQGWLRLRDGEPMDTLALLVGVDAFPPAIFFSDFPVSWVPTVELTAHVRRRPVPGWLACSFTTRFVTDGFLEEDGLIWDAAGNLVAQSRQLALVPRG